MTSPSNSFSNSYATARQKFLAAAQEHHLTVDSYPHPLPGREGEDLAMDVVRDGPADATRLLIVSSACHGVEGFCGSGVQVDCLRDAAWRASLTEQGVAVLYVHALNPHGFSHLRRVTHENVDLNRNFLNFQEPLPENPGYLELEAILLPETWPPSADNQRALQAYLAQHGLRHFQTVVSTGQYQSPTGMFFGGQAPTWSQQTLRQVLRHYGAGMTTVGWIDLHTGLGPIGVGERIYAGRDDASELARAQAWWGANITSVYDGSSSSPLLKGLMWMSIYDECPHAHYAGIALEYGTYAPEIVIEALRADHWLHRHPEAPAELRASIQQQMIDNFYVNTPAWHTDILTQARAAMVEAVAGMVATEQ